jgi:transcription initiation factor TFIID subunit TAF12
MMEVARNGVGDGTGNGTGPAAAAAIADGPRALPHISSEQQQQQQQRQRQQQQQRRLISESLESTVSLPTLPSGLLGDAMEKESPAVAHELRRAAADALGIAADGSAANVRQAPSAAGPLSVSTDGTSGEVRVRCTLSVVR